MIRIKVTDLEGREHVLEASLDIPLMEALREPAWGVEAVCGGMCSCGTCHVYLDPQWLDSFPAKGIDEEELLDFLDYAKPNSRLSCQLLIQPQHEGLSLKLAPQE
ncbi:MAG: 2Fe-2S iron-sulfur cluster-binding protein [Xanthomonadales bacterium]|nr:2Fe-2S iron-sulfur cluster-binding protein [Xanthomonadales bacterium]